MKVLKNLKLRVDGEEKTIVFGIPETNLELEQMYELRYKQYSQKGYIDITKYEDTREIDAYDLLNKCKYFVAVYQDKMIGTARLIFDNPLPTQKTYIFETPIEIQNIPIDRRCEIGRLVIIPPDREKNIFLPRNVVMLLMFDCILDYCIENKIDGGFAFIKKTLNNKLKKLKLPFHEIEQYKENYTDEDTLFLYFKQKNDPVVPIYFLSKEFKKRLKFFLTYSFILRKEGDQVYKLNKNIYTLILKRFKII
jgi:N-acyl-L-homoserine lactone synthetase